MLIWLFQPLLAAATHLVGGCIELRWISGDSYELTVRILRDCENGSPEAYFDNPIAVGIFEKNTHIKKNQFLLNFQRINDDTLKFTGDNCANIITGCTHIGTYRQIITLNSNTYNSNNGYYLSWQRCCRNGIINNIVNPGDAGLCLYSEVPNLRTVKNSTPRFTNNPVTLMCANNLFEYNMDFKDDDGDELRYSLVDPLNGHLDKFGPSSTTATSGPYPTTVWRTPFGSINAITGQVPLSIDPSTGKISCNPSNPGIYVASIRVEEYRFGIKIGEVRLELQFTVTNCPNTPPLATLTTINNDILLEDTILVEVPQNICVNIRGLDATDSVYLKITCDSIINGLASKPDFDSLTAGYKLATTSICWQTNCDLDSATRSFGFQVYAYDNGCPISRNSTSRFWIKVKPMPLVNPTDMLCMTLLNNKETYVYYGDSTSPANPYWDYYLVFRGINYRNYQVIDTVRSKGLRQFHDPNTPNYSGINYTYYMRGVNKCGRWGPTSDTISTFEQLSFVPQLQYLKYVTVTNNRDIEMEWVPSTEKDFAKYFLYKAKRNQAKFELIATFEEPDETKFVDTKVNVADTSYCYYVVMKDTCDNIGPPGPMSCSILLQGKAADFMSNLSWNAYTGWSGGVDQYQVYRADPATPFEMIASNPSSVMRLTDSKLNLNEGLFLYYVKGKELFSDLTAPFFGAESQSNTIQLWQSPTVYVPNAVTANGDGLNDQFHWVPVFVKDFKITIYNRWGQMVYESNNKLEPWNGKINGNEVQADVYFYVIKYTGWEGTDMTKSGNFTIIR